MTRLSLLLLLLTPTLARAGGLPTAEPSSLGFDPDRLALASQAVREAVEKGEVPGAVVLVGRHGKIALIEPLGQRSVSPAAEPMTRDTLFDLASLTKPVATATSVMLLWQQGKLDPRDLLSKHLPEFANHGKEAITLEHLLRHRSGLIADNPLSDYADGPEKSWERLANLPTLYPPGSRFLYSDVNFLILGRLVERLSGQTLDQFAKEHVFTPLGMADTTFLPLDGGLPADRIAPTEPDSGQMIRGIVHDPRSRALGGVAGHAGLFGTADDLAVYVDSLLNESPVLSRPTIWAMTDPGDTPDGQRRGLGWDLATGFSAPRGARFGPRSFGHTGFTGTSLWADPDTGAFVILLTSRLHPDGKGSSPTSLRRKLASLVAEALTDQPTAQPTPPNEPVLCGIDVLASENFARLQGKRVGLVTNHTGRTRSGQPTIDALFKAPGVQLKALFSPEHGIRGAVDTKVADSTDEATGLPIYSLYGETRKPRPEHLADLDVLVYDIQDIGCRFYTYIGTLVHVMEAAKERGIPVVVLDRPNPIGGLAVEGPVRDDGFESFIAIHDLPVRHGMTVGELARMFNAERKIGADLDVVACQNWKRSDLYDRTGLEWVNPSPNMRSLTEALLYPGVGLLEATNLATGRGTDTPFERVGAPWIDPLAWAAALNAAALPGVRFVPIHFTPTERQHVNKPCGGVYILITDRDRFEPISLCFAMVRTLRSLYPDDWKPEGFLRFITDKQAYESSLAGHDYRSIRAAWREELASFLTRRAAFLLYE